MGSLDSEALGLPLVRQDGTIEAFTVVDPEDYAWASRFVWHRDAHGYAKTGGRKFTWLHRAVLGLTPGDPRWGDHINRDPLDNRRANLRIITAGESTQNRRSWGKSSKHRGVTAYKGKWLARAGAGGRVRLGLFDDEDEAGVAAAAYREAHMPYATD